MDNERTTVATIDERLDEIDQHLAAVARTTQPGSPDKELAYAVHNLINVIKDIRRGVR